MWKSRPGPSVSERPRLVLSAWIMLGEAPSALEILGGVIVLTGLALVTGVAGGALRVARQRLRPAA